MDSTDEASQWYLLAGSSVEGPFSLRQLRHHPSLTPDTLVRRHGSQIWQKARQVPELSDLFKDAEALEDECPEEAAIELAPSGDELTMAFEERPVPSWPWILCAILVLAYVYYQFWLRH